MSVRVKLRDIADEMTGQFTEMSLLLSKKTGEVVLITDEVVCAAEYDDPLEAYPEWQHEMIEIAKDVMNNPEDYISLPSKYDINDYDIMRRFCASVEDEKKSNYLLYAIRGKGAFRRFKNAVDRLGMSEQWFAFRDEAYREIARDWCEYHSIEYEE